MGKAIERQMNNGMRPKRKKVLAREEKERQQKHQKLEDPNEETKTEHKMEVEGGSGL